MHAALIDLNDPSQPPIDVTADAPVKIGRHKSNTIVVHDEHCSRHHAVIAVEDGLWVLHDKGSQNGSFVDGNLVTTAVLHDGQELRFGGLRYRFDVRSEGGAVANGAGPVSDEDENPTPVPESAIALLDETSFQAEQLTALCRFMAEATNDTDPRQLIRRALETVLANTKADVVGFIGLDDEGRNVPRMVLPTESEVDAQLSKHLTSEVQARRRAIWLNAETRQFASDSLCNYTDAICVPMPIKDRWLGALHAYRRTKSFGELAPRFCEVVARHLAERLHHVRRSRHLQDENLSLRARDMLADRLIGRSDVIKKLDREVKRAALHRDTVLIRGETGVGKELVARALHEGSPWSDGPFVPVNCASLRGELFESQLFGHRKGAFTGATIDRDGAFVQADGGTLFLDEIGQLEPNLQARLLRVLEDGLVQPLGSDRLVAVTVRVIVATNDDLDAMVRDDEFREDLLYRLRIVDIEVAPLREHMEDLPDLLEYYLPKLEKLHNAPLRLTPQAVRRLQEHTWPGNVRELLNTLRAAAAQADSWVIDVGDIRLKGEAKTASVPTLLLKDLERLAYEESARRTAQNPVEMAKLLGVSRTTVYGKLKDYGWIVDKPAPE